MYPLWDMLHITFLGLGAMGTVIIPILLLRYSRKMDTKSKRAVVTIIDIRTDNEFQFKTKGDLTDTLKEVKSELDGKGRAVLGTLHSDLKNNDELYNQFMELRGLPKDVFVTKCESLLDKRTDSKKIFDDLYAAVNICSELSEEELHKLHDTKETIFFTNLGQLGLEDGTLILNLIKERDDVRNGACLCKCLNKITFKSHGELASYIRFYACEIEYLEGNKRRVLQSAGEPIRLRFNESREATLYCSEATARLEDALCDILRLDSSKSVDQIDFDKKFLYYRKITILAEVASVFDDKYNCQIVIECRHNRTIFYTSDLTPAQRRMIK